MGGASFSLLQFGLLNIEPEVLLYSENTLVLTFLLPSLLPTLFPSPPQAASGGSLSHKSKLVKFAAAEQKGGEKKKTEQLVGLKLQQ